MLRQLSVSLSAWVVALFLIANAHAADLTVGSLNALHLGWGATATTKSKCDQIKVLMATVDILFLQETMQTSVPCTGLGTGVQQDCSGMKGASSYKEAYCYVYKSSKITVVAYINAPSASFSRPPYAILTKIKVTGKADKYAWFANIHSVFGKTVKPRQDEATAAGAFFKSLTTTTYGTITVPPKGFPVIIGGDWNLAVTSKKNVYQTGFKWVDPVANPTTAPQACPDNDPTSLTTKGAPSSPYDHLIITGVSLTGDPSCYLTTNSLSGLGWRQNVSDHMAIYWGVTFK
ncbi:deoxyribonuclease [Pseudomonas sp. CDFA 610]|uniref:deoxyribonuclease n=1 Tax=Pseudomonas sp. CDFA 610 TaxID=2829825 RepID=UPI001E48598A|nr:deoxyribonuclease [Pseudomonas sp. CDFA 610]MCD5985962.1 deoxyribonuclease [Pseudomonas sp. CDFA 610]